MKFLMSWRGGFLSCGMAKQVDVGGTKNVKGGGKFLTGDLVEEY